MTGKMTFFAFKSQGGGAAGHVPVIPQVFELAFVLNSIVLCVRVFWYLAKQNNVYL